MTSTYATEQKFKHQATEALSRLLINGEDDTQFGDVILTMAITENNLKDYIC